MGTLSRFSAKKGFDANNFTVVNVSDPVNAQDASTKAFSSNASNLTSGSVPLARLPVLGNGQLYVGSAGVAPVATTLTQGSGITITNAAGSITISASSQSLSIAKPTANYSAALTDDVIIANGNFTVTLPTAVSAANKEFVIKRISASGSINIVVSGGGTIDKNTTVTLNTRFAAITVVSDGTEYWIV